LITPEGIKPDPAKVEQIVNYKTPTSADEVRSFLGLVGYYRKFSPNFGAIARPLTRKTHKDMLKQPFIWTEEDQKAFETLRDRLITPPVLAYPNFDEKFLLFTDACDYGIGAVLSKIQNGEEHPIAYASRQLRKEEIKYHTTEKEALAIVFAIKHFKHYLLDKPFEIITDHAALQWLKNQKDSNGRLGRWAIELAGVPYEIRYRPGRVHQNADALSRLKVASLTTTQTEEKVNIICDSQNEDELCKEIKNYLDNGILDKKFENNKPDWAKEIEYFEVIDGILYRREIMTKKSKRNEINHQLVLPLSLRLQVVKEIHDGPMGGHFAFLRTYLRVKNNYYWPTMRKDIKEYCQACVECTSNSKSKLRGCLHPHDLAQAPFQVIGIDFLGPITPSSQNGSKFILVITDYFSRWPEAVALKDQKALTTAKCLFDTVVTRHGFPRAIVSDRGANFTSKLFKYFCDKLNIKHKLTTAYHPASNGETERFNRTLTTMLRKELQDGAHEDWEELIDPLLFAYRNSVHSSTKETPHFILHGRDANIPVNELLSAVPKTNISLSDYVGNMMNRLRFSFQRVKEENEKAREIQRKQYDKRAKEFKYKVGDKVLLDVVVVKVGDSKKFTSKYKGPFRVIKVYSNKTLDIVDTSYNTQRVHVNRVKPLFETMLWKDESCPLYEEATTKASEAIDQQTDESERNKVDDERCESEDNDTDWESEDCDSEIGVAAPLTPPVILLSSTSSTIRGDVGKARDERKGTNNSEGINNQKKNRRQTKLYGNLANENELDEVGITECKNRVRRRFKNKFKKLNQKKKKKLEKKD
jgi:transposase InsO family protein/phosphotransferase system HPr-like phosphotransfer protein